MNKILTSFMTHPVAEGQMLSYTYSEVNEDGTFQRRNTKASFLVTDPDVLAHISEIEAYIRDNKLAVGS